MLTIDMRDIKTLPSEITDLMDEIWPDAPLEVTVDITYDPGCPATYDCPAEPESVEVEPVSAQDIWNENYGRFSRQAKPIVLYFELFVHIALWWDIEGDDWLLGYLREMRE